MSELVTKLSTGNHDVEISVYPDKSIDAFKECVDDGYVHVRFPNTKGGTTLGVTLDPRLSDLSAADFAAHSGRAVLAGELILDYVPVRCEAVIDLSTLKGTGRLVVQARG